MLIVEIILTIVAWQRGWKWIALIPVGIAFFIGMAIGANSSDPVDPLSVIWIDVLAIIALVLMLIFKPQSKI